MLRPVLVLVVKFILLMGAVSFVAFVLMALAWVCAGVFGFALGVTAGVYRGRMVDGVIRAYCYISTACLIHVCAAGVLEGTGRA